MKIPRNMAIDNLEGIQQTVQDAGRLAPDEAVNFRAMADADLIAEYLLSGLLVTDFPGVGEHEVEGLEEDAEEVPETPRSP